LQRLHDEATRIVAPHTGEVKSCDLADREGLPSDSGAGVSTGAQTKRQKVLQSLLEHWPGLTLFVEHPEVPMDNNRGENAIRHPVTDRNYVNCKIMPSYHSRIPNSSTFLLLNA
jgi:Transposase IS66 family